jgi:hypothetical protein
MPAKAGIHSHRPVIMDSGFRRNDIREGFANPTAMRGLWASILSYLCSSVVTFSRRFSGETAAAALAR